MHSQLNRAKPDAPSQAHLQDTQGRHTKLTLQKSLYLADTLRERKPTHKKK